MTMNDYGRRAMAFWQQQMPQELAEMPDPQAYFSTLGQEIETKVDQLAISLAGPDSPGEQYLAKVGRLRAATQQAEERVMHDLVYSLAPTEPYQDTDEDLDNDNDPIAQTLKVLRREKAIRQAELEEDQAAWDREWWERTRSQRNGH